MLQRLMDFYYGPYFMPILLFFGPVAFLLYYGYQPTPPNLPSAKEDHNRKKELATNGDASSARGKEAEKKAGANEGIRPSSLFGNQSGTGQKKLPAPLNKPYTKEELAKYDGTDESLPIYLALKGDIFDVSESGSSYAPGGAYHMFVAKDASRALGISSLSLKDCTDDLSGMTAQQLKTLDDWYKFFHTRYPIVGKLVKND